MGDNSRTMTAKEFDTILKQLGLTRAAAAKALGLSQRTVASYAHSRQKAAALARTRCEGALKRARQRTLIRPRRQDDARRRTKFQSGP